MEAKKAAIIKFMETPLKQPSSREVLQRLLNDEELLSKSFFVASRESLPNTLLISQESSMQPGFEMELGVKQFEEVSIVNGRLVRHVRKTCRLHIDEPQQALSVLKGFSDKLFIEFSFAGKVPYWYKRVISPNPAQRTDKDSCRTFKSVIDEIICDQIDLALWTILLRDKIDRALEERDEEVFRHYVGIYNRVRERCLWDFD